MAIILRSESVWSDEAGETEMMEVGREENGRKSPKKVSVRPSFVDASVAYHQVSKGRACGKKKTLWLRLVMQKYLSQLGNFLQVHCGKIVFVGLVALLMSCLGLKTYQMESDIKKLWIDAGSRMSREMKYTEDALGLDGGELNEAIIQVPDDEGRNILTVESLLLHLDVLKVVTSVTVDVLDVTWRFKDICHVISLNYFEHGSSFNDILENLGPCLIISPLECFWEGSKLAGPDKPVMIPHYGHADWTNLNPQEVLNKLSSLSPSMVDEVREIIEKAGISTGYQEKPCLDPFDLKCPESAPNFLSKEPPDVASVLSQGCDGFARKFLHWNEDLILGGVQRNKSGHIVRAKALQSIIFLLGEKNLYEMFKGVLLPWNETLAEEVIRVWEKQMTKDVDKFLSSQNGGGLHDLRALTTAQRKPKSRDNVHSFTSSNMAEMLADSSQVSIARVVLGLLLMFCYSILVNANFKRCSESQATVAMSGLLLLVVSTTAGLGLCSVLQLTFNAITTQVVPFLVICFGMDHIFLILNTYTQMSKDGVPYKERTGACLRRVGGLVVTSSVCNSSSFLLASLLPIPATRFFCLQCCLLTLVNGASVLLLFPAIVSIDLTRRKHGKLDFFCCQFRPPPPTSSTSISYAKSKYRSSSSSSSLSSSSSSSSNRSRWASTKYDNDDDDEFEEISIFTFKSKDNNNKNNNSKYPEQGSLARNNNELTRDQSSSSRSSGISSLASSNHDLLTYPPTLVYLPTPTPPQQTTLKRRNVCSSFNDCVLSEFIRRFYGPFLEKLPVKIIVIVLFIICIVVGVAGVLRVKEGLEVIDVLPLSSPEREFLRVQTKYFGFYNFYVATQDNFDYASQHGQQLLHSFHHSIRSIKNIIRSKDGKFFEFWLETFQNWLLDVQEALDLDLKRGAIVRDEWFANSTSLGRLGYKLMIQTGMKSSPIDRNRIYTGRLVTNGIIYTPAFYNYLSAWANNDVFSYDFLQANIKPSPKRWTHDKNDPDCNVPQSNPIVFVQGAFVFNNLHSFEAKMNVLSDIRNVCDTFASRGLPSYPHGFVVMFWEQYFSVRFYLFILISVMLGVVFVVALTVLLNPFAAFLEVFVLACTMVELYGFMGLVGIKMSALSAVILIITIGVTVHNTIPFVLAFQTCIGSRDRRMILSLEQVVTPVLHFFVVAFLGLLVLATTELVFIRSYIFIPIVAMLIIGCFNGVVFLPVLLSLVGPSPEVTPLNNDLYLPPPSPVLRPQITPRLKSRSGQKASYKTRKKSRLGRSRGRITTRLKDPPNLSTIVEESSNNSCASSISIDLKPTIIISNPPHCCNTSQAQATSTPGNDAAELRESRSAPADPGGRKLPTTGCYLHSSTGSTSVSSPVQISSCSSSSHCFTMVEATTKVKVHICDQKETKCRIPPRQKTSKRDRSSDGHHHHKRARH